MGRLKFTSPGVLLIFSIIAAGSIFLLDAFYLWPQVEAQKNETLRHQAILAKHKAQFVLLAEADVLQRVSAAVAGSVELRRMLQSKSPSGQFHDFASATLADAGAELAWVSDAEGNLTALWRKNSQVSEGKSAHPDAELLAASAREMAGSGEPTRSGLLGGGDRVAVFARSEISEISETKDQTGIGGQVLGTLWLARYVDVSLCRKVGSATSGTATMVVGETLPAGTSALSSEAQTIWPLGRDSLAVAWLLCGVEGESLGYFCLEVPVVQIQLQVAAARRMVLIILWLSAGLVLLSILGMHILIAGPIVRLVNRLYQMESDQESVRDLTRDLHGEPLILARRLESAFSKLAQMTRTDQLTQLANRRGFQDVLESFYQQARRYNRPLSLMMIDVDFFKAVNDTSGHQAGDELLKSIAQSVGQACRKADLPARLGGDEFAVLMPETTAEDAEAVAERVRKTVAAADVAGASTEYKVTLSVGITDLNSGEIDSADAMASLADQAMYAAKELGRNRCVQAHDLTGVNLNTRSKPSGNMDAMCKKIAGLDIQFKSVFVKGIEQILQLLGERDPNMIHHAQNVRRYSTVIAREMQLPQRVIDRVAIAATLHDIGMIAMPDSILLSGQALSQQDRKMLRRHPLLSVRIMERMEFLQQEIPAVRYHHERYDGKGYPEGIAGSAIPLTARILTIADAFDAMTSHRAYRSGTKSYTEALAELKQEAAAQFDPAIVDAFLLAAERLGEKLMDETLLDDAPEFAETVSS